MVFSQFRSSVAEITDCLRHFHGISPVEFKGQGDGGRKEPKKKETEGKKRKSVGRMTQKKQLEIIQAFKDGRLDKMEFYRM